MNASLLDTIRQFPRMKASPNMQDEHETGDRCPAHNAGLFRLRDENGNLGTARGCHFGCVLKLDSFESLVRV
jgi:hypothetical protein